MIEVTYQLTPMSDVQKLDAPDVPALYDQQEFRRLVKRPHCVQAFSVESDNYWIVAIHGAIDGLRRGLDSSGTFMWMGDDARTIVANLEIVS